MESINHNTQKSNYTEEYITEADLSMEMSGKMLSFKDKITYFVLSPYWTIIVIIIVGFISFLLGRLSYFESKKDPVKVYYKDTTALNTLEQTLNTAQNISSLNNQKENILTSAPAIVVASKLGKKYHLPTCPGAKQISEKNLITFNSIEDARSAGFTPASNCKGLK